MADEVVVVSSPPSLQNPASANPPLAEDLNPELYEWNSANDELPDPNSAVDEFQNSALPNSTLGELPRSSEFSPTSAAEFESANVDLSGSSNTELTGSSSIPKFGSRVAALDRLLHIFVGATLSAKQVTTIYTFFGGNFDAASQALLHGPTLNSILDVSNKRFEVMPMLKLRIDSDDLWSDLVSEYKSGRMNFQHQVRVRLDNQPPVDTGGVRRQVYCRAFDYFAKNKFIELFDGPENHLRPSCSADARSSGLFKILGSMISHSICQDSIGFPFLSPTCYWYLVGGDEKALEYASLQDLPADAALLVTQVWGCPLSFYSCRS